MKSGTIQSVILLINICLAAGCNEQATNDNTSSSVTTFSQSIQGEWIEADNLQYIQGFALNNNGSAIEIGTHTLTYSAWKFSENQLLLTGKSIGNGQTIDFTDTLQVLRTDSILVLKNKWGKEIKYRHPN
jgi:hypothetical protein